MAYNSTTNTINATPVNPAFQSGGADIAPVKPGQNLGNVQSLGAINTTPTVPNAPINTSQPSPTNTNTIQAGIQQAQVQAQSIADQIASKYKTGLSNVQGTTPPTSTGDAMTGVTANTTPITPPTPPNPIITTLQNDPGYQQLQADYKAYTDSVNKQQSLTDLYSQMEKDSNLPGLKIEAMNLKNIIDGTENDIRQEIQKSGGFATNSQVLALTSARNKQNILDYNKLEDNIKNVQDHLDTMIGLSKEDKANALTTYKTQIDYDKTIADYTEKFTTNAKDAYNNIISTPGYGYQALYQSTGGDATHISQIEQSLGLPSGMLAQLGSITPPGKYSVVKGGTDAFGNPLPDQIFNSQTGQLGVGGKSDTSGVGTGATSQASGTGIIGSNNLGVSNSKLSFNQYGLLANTNFKSTNMVDQLAQKYLDQYIKNGTVPTASSLGRNMKPEAMAQVDSRARDLYYQATGSPLPNPQVIKGYQQIIESNNKLANNLQVQEQTVKQNVDLSIANMKKYDLNSSNFQPLNNFINNVQSMFSDPAVGQLIAQNSTIQNELGSLLAVKNASGTTVFDKMASAGIISKNDTQAVITSKVNALLQEATNFAGSLANANANMYKQVDPFLQDSNNPARNQMIVETALNKTGTNYNNVISKTPTGQMPVLDTASGQVGYITPSEFISSKYIKL